MPAGNHTIFIEQGATFEETFTWKIKDPYGVFQPVNLTGYTARMHVRESYDSDAIVLELTTSNGGITLGGAAGTIMLTVSATETAALPNGYYVYDIELVNGATVERKLKGQVVIDPEVTR